MAFEKTINKVVSVGAYEINFNDDKQEASIGYSEYEDGKAVKFVARKTIPFSELQEKDAETFATMIQCIQTLCDAYNPEAPVEP